MMEERKVPALRFQGFTDEWEAQLFGSFAARESKAQISSKAYPCVEYEDIIAGEGVLNKDVRSKGISKKASNLIIPWYFMVNSAHICIICWFLSFPEWQ